MPTAAPITVTLGPGSLKLGTPGTDFSCEVLSGRVTHGYNEIGESRTVLCGTVKPATRVRQDGLAFNLENDLGAAGLYKYLLDNDLREVDFEYVPNTAQAAKWSGKIVATLPGTVGADQFGSPVASEVEWAGVGTFNFTPAADPAANPAPAPDQTA